VGFRKEEKKKTGQWGEKKMVHEIMQDPQTRQEDFLEEEGKKKEKKTTVWAKISPHRDGHPAGMLVFG